MIAATTIVSGVFVAVATIAGCSPTTAPPTVEAPPVTVAVEAPPRPVCDQDEEGYVFQYYTDDDFGCDVVAGQTLALTGTPGPDECADMGGYAYIPYVDTTDDGWDDAAYGDCFGVDF